MSEILEPCPFCGSHQNESHRFMQPTAYDRRYRRCTHCEAHGPIKNGVKLSDEAWNHRVEPTELAALRAEVEQLRAERDAAASVLVTLCKGYRPDLPASTVMEDTRDVIRQTIEMADPDEQAEIAAIVFPAPEPGPTAGTNGG